MGKQNWFLARPQVRNSVIDRFLNLSQSRFITNGKRHTQTKTYRKTIIPDVVPLIRDTASVPGPFLWPFHLREYAHKDTDRDSA